MEVGWHVMFDARELVLERSPADARNSEVKVRALPIAEREGSSSSQLLMNCRLRSKRFCGAVYAGINGNRTGSFKWHLR